MDELREASLHLPAYIVLKTEHLYLEGLRELYGIVPKSLFAPHAPVMNSQTFSFED